jgi:hypothetical protein
MEDKRGTKRPHPPSKEGSSSPSSASTSLSAPSGSPLPLGSPLEISSDCLHSPGFEQGRPSEKVPVVDLSSDEENVFPDTTRDEDFARRLFGDLNHHYVRKAQSRRAHMKNGDAHIARLRHHVSHYRVIGDTQSGASLNTTHQRHAWF